MKNNTPGFSTEKSYPYNGIESKALFSDKYRLNPYQSLKGEIIIDIDSDSYPDIVNRSPDTRTSFETFLLNRLFEYSEALKICEGQVDEIFKDDPFNPEHFGFTLVHKNSAITEPPVKIYVSTYDNNIVLFRKPSSPMDEDYSPSMWIVQKKDADGNIVPVELNLPNKRIAIAALWSVGVPVQSEENTSEITIPNEKALDDSTKERPPIVKAFLDGDDEEYRRQQNINYLKRNNYTHAISFYRNGFDFILEFVNDDSDKDALSSAKFLIETNQDYNVQNVLFEELKVVASLKK